MLRLIMLEAHQKRPARNRADRYGTAALLTACLLLALGTPGRARNIYVAPDGHDRNKGDRPWAALHTIQTAVNRLQPGDTLILAPGEYLQQFVVRQSGTADRPITIRAAVPGFSVIRGSVRVGGFRKVEGTRFIYATKTPQHVLRVYGVDSRSLYLPAPALIDMDQFRRSFLYDNGVLYVHTIDGEPPERHVLTATVLAGHGIEIQGSYVHLDGLVIRGFGPRAKRDAGRSFGIRLSGAHHEIRNCTLLYNGGGISVGAQDAVVRDNLLIGNLDPFHGEMGQIYCGHGSENVQVIRNTVLDAPTHGIRFYEGARHGTAVGNIVRNARIGLYFKASRGTRVARNNVVIGCSTWNFHTGTGTDPLTEDHNTFAQPSGWSKANQAGPGPHTLVYDAKKADPKFADPDHLDYRLQADSPYRSAGPDGSTPGAYPYEPTVFYVGPEGDDANDGLSIARAFRTLRHAIAQVGPGITLYVLPGRYDEPLGPLPAGTRDRPLVIRGWGRAVAARIAGLDLTGGKHIRIENLWIAGPTVIRKAEDIRIRRCMFNRPKGDAVRIEDSVNVWIRRSTCWDTDGVPVRIAGRCHGIAITSSILHSRRSPAIESDVGRHNELFFEYNDYLPATGQPIARIAGKTVTSVEQLHDLLGADRYSFSADPRLVAPDASAEIRPGSPCVAAGELGENIGAGTTQVVKPTPTIEEVTLRDRTPTSLSLTWWTPHTSTAAWRPPAGWYEQMPVISEIHYGTSDALDQLAYSLGDVYHRVTLRDLKPGTTYHVKIRIPARPRADSLYHPYGPDPEAPRNLPAESPVFTYTTPAVDDWHPPRRTIYVSPAGSPENSGLDRRAPTSLTAAGDKVRTGDTVVLLDGIYEESFVPAATGTPEAPLTLKADHPGKACLDGSDYIRPNGIALFGQNDIVIDGLVFRRFGTGPLACRAGFADGQILLLRTGTARITNCVLAGWGTYTLGVVGRAPRKLRIENCVFTGCVAGVVARGGEQTELIGNTWHVPLIRNLDVSGRLVIKNNLFFGQHRQKVFNYVPMVIARKPEVSDYNAYYFGPHNPVRYIGYGIRRTREKDMGGVARIQKELALDLHSLEPAPSAVRFRGPVPVDYLNQRVLDRFAIQISRGRLIPTLEMFDLPADSPLNTAGEHGGPIGARPASRR